MTRGCAAESRQVVSLPGRRLAAAENGGIVSDISVIGLGAMGGALARALLQSGYSVTVWNRSPEKAEPLVAAGAVAAASAEEAIQASPATVTCIASHDKTLALMRSVGDAVAGRTVIELSTGGAAEAGALAAYLASKGADWMIGIINAYPTAVGKAETVLLTGLRAGGLAKVAGRGARPRWRFATGRGRRGDAGGTVRRALHDAAGLHVRHDIWRARLQEGGHPA